MSALGPNRPRRERQLERLVKEAIGREVLEPAEQSRLERLLQERLDDDDIRRDLARCSLGELIQRIRKDLGIEPDWTMWETEGWAQAEISERPPGSLYAERPDPESWEELDKRLPKIEKVIVSRAEDGAWVKTPYVPKPPSG